MPYHFPLVQPTLFVGCSSGNLQYMWCSQAIFFSGRIWGVNTHFFSLLSYQSNLVLVIDYCGVYPCFTSVSPHLFKLVWSYRYILSNVPHVNRDMQLLDIKGFCNQLKPNKILAWTWPITRFPVYVNVASHYRCCSLSGGLANVKVRKQDSRPLEWGFASLFSSHGSDKLGHHCCHLKAQRRHCVVSADKRIASPSAGNYRAELSQTCYY